jgi:CDP-diacylglycerol--serine O-phosphatidyltransferase
VTLAMLYLGQDHPEILSKIKFLLVVLMLLVSFLMFSNIKYPSFKDLKIGKQRPVPAVLVAILLVVFTVRYYEWMPAVVFTLYLVYGLVRPSISRRWRREIEVLDDDDEEANVSTVDAKESESSAGA